MGSTFIPVILAGGKGERFWPLSRRQRPKQFLALEGNGLSLLQATAQRLLTLAGGWQQIWVITAAPIAQGVREQLPDLPPGNLLVEPEGKDTAPAVAWASLEISRQYGLDTVMGFFPADHHIGKPDLFDRTITTAIAFAQNHNAIVTLGIHPHHPATGYGYIEQGQLAPTTLDLPIYKVTRFTEKPDASKAAEFIATGRFSWNSGMFFFRAGVVLAELARHAPQILEPLQTKGVAAYGELEKKSIDYALMEKTDLAYVLPCDFDWDDLGDWNALERLQSKTTANVDGGHHLATESQGCIVYAENEEEVIVTLGVKDLVIVRSGSVTLVMPKSRTQEIKTILKSLQNEPDYRHLL